MPQISFERRQSDEHESDKCSVHGSPTTSRHCSRASGGCILTLHDGNLKTLVSTLCMSDQGVSHDSKQESP